MKSSGTFLFQKLLVVLLMILPILSFSIGDTADEKPDSIYTFVEKAPEFRGGIEALQMYLNLSLSYPEPAVNEGIQGTVYVQFVVEKDGIISNVIVIRSVGGGCDEEAIRVVNEMPPWIPGSIKNKKVRVSMTFPVTFRLQQNSVDIHETYLEAERMPYMFGGQMEMDNYLLKSLKYPARAKDENINGIVNLTFVVERDGAISKIVVVDSLGYGCDEEAVRVVGSMPAWVPGMINDVPVRVMLSMSVEFPPAVTFADEMPEFLGGMNSLYNYIANNVTYPQQAIDRGIEGKVWVNFIVETDGSITNVNVTNGIGGGCDEEAMKVLANMPKWKPGKNEGKPVRVSFNMPVSFKLK